MEQAELQLISVALGGGLALGGSVLAHIFARARDARNRQIDGLREVARELQRRVRLSLNMVQLVNGGLRNKTPDEFSRTAFEIEGWREVTLTLQERTWRFACMAFLPEAIADFEAIDQNIFASMDVHNQPLFEGAPHPQHALAHELHNLIASVEAKIEGRLRRIV